MIRNTLLLSLVTFCWLAAASQAQDLPQLNIVDQLGGPGLSGLGGGDKATFAGEFQIEQGSRQGRLSIVATIEPNWHVYSVTQAPGGPMKSEIKVAESPDFRVSGPFQPDAPPHVSSSEFFPVPIEEHSDKVTWTAPIRLSNNVAPESLKIEVKFSGQVCMDDGACIPILNKPVAVKFAGYYNPPQIARQYRGDGERVQLSGSISPATAKPGDTMTLTITAELDPEWHIYAYAKQDPMLIAKPTLIAITQPVDWQAGAVQASDEPLAHETGLDQEPITHFHEQSVSWKVPIQIPVDAAPGEHTIQGLIGYQTCTLAQCDLPRAASFSAVLQVGTTSSDGAIPLGFTPARYQEVAKLAGSQSEAAAAAGSQAASAGVPPTATSDRAGFDRSRINVTDKTKDQPIWAAIAIALAGGFILNFMPCVLPVIGLKVMSFVQQAGESRARAFALNLWYTLGLMSVFMVLATLAAVWSVGWGQQNQSPTFNIVMASVVFTMGLSFLGVWEIPIPGFVGAGAANELQAQEGATGAFFKGVVTTILAVPCSGPLVATALTWAAGKPPALVYLTFACMGLGMAAPYLVMGAFPDLMRFMPKPGQWMNTFKEVMGFVLLGTVIWIFSYLPWPLVLPTLAFLFGLWFACWWIGRTPLTESWPVKLRAWAGAAAFAALIGMFSFHWLDDVMAQRFTAAVEREMAAAQFARTDAAAPDAQSVQTASEKHLPWRPFSVASLQQHTSQGKTVMVDFTADWCPTCKVLEAKTLNTEIVKQAVERNGVVPLLADWTEPSEEISEMLELLGSKQIPVLAIFPADRPNEPIVLRGWYSAETLLQKLEEAGPSANRTVMTTSDSPAVALE